MTDDDIKRALVNAHRAGDTVSAERLAGMLNKPKPTAADRAKAVGTSALAGLSDPLYGASQLISRAGQFVSSAGGNFENPVSDFFGEEAALYDRLQKEQSARVSDARDQAGFEGFDVTRLAGNIINPINAVPALGVAGKLGQGASVAGSALKGAAAGMYGGATAPVENTDNYAGEKFAQIGLGGIGGAVATPIANKLGSAISSVVARAKNMATRPPPDEVIMRALAEAKIDADDISASQMAALRKQVTDALKYGGEIDPAAALRKADADALGIDLTKGQLTRAPMQFAREKNLRGVEGVGEDITARLDSQDARLAELVNARAKGALEPDVAGDMLMSRADSVNRQMGRRVNDLYEAAKRSPDAVSDVPMTGLADDIARIASEYEGSIPKGLLNRFKAYGLYSDKIDDAAKQTKIFDMLEAEKLLKATNEYGDVTNKSTQSGINKVRDALKRAITEGADDGGPFALPRAAARERFRLQDAVPALKDVAEGRAAPEKFFDKYILRATPKQVQSLAGVLDDEGIEQVRAQIGERLRGAGYGNNLAGDKKLTPERFASELKRIGTTRLKAFFSDAEVEEMQRIARVGAYLETPPGNAAVNFSNTSAAAANIGAFGRALGREAPILSSLGRVAQRYTDIKDAQQALNGVLPTTSPLLSEAANRRLGRLSAGAGLGSGLFLLGPN